MAQDEPNQRLGFRGDGVGVKGAEAGTPVPNQQGQPAASHPAGQGGWTRPGPGGTDTAPPWQEDNTRQGGAGWVTPAGTQGPFCLWEDSFHNTPQPLVGQTIEASGSWQRSGCGTNIPLWESVTCKNGGAEHGSESVPPLEVKEASEGRGVLTAAAGIPSGSMLDTVLYSHLNYSFNKHPRPSEDQEYGRERCQHDPLSLLTYFSLRHVGQHCHSHHANEEREAQRDAWVQGHAVRTQQRCSPH